MFSGINAVVLFLIVNLAIAAFCSQACGRPQPDSTQCPQHQHSGNTNCCDHSSDATLTFKVNCASELKSMTVLYTPQPEMNSFHLRIPGPTELQTIHPPDSVLSPASIELSAVLRI